MQERKKMTVKDKGK